MTMVDRKISEVGTRIRQAREALGEKPSVFAARTGVSRDTLDRYELGKQSPKAEYLAKVAGACGVLEAWLLTGEGPMRRGEEAGEGVPGRAEIDPEALADAWEATEEHLAELGAHLPLRKKAELVALLYNEDQEREAHRAASPPGLLKRITAIIKGGRT